LADLLHQFSAWYLSVLGQGGYWLIAGLMALESTVVPIPSEVIIPPAAHYAHTHPGGKVTIGIGHAIETPADALTLTWSIDGQPAAGDEIQADYASVAAAQKGLVAKAYAPLTQSRMADADIDALISSDVTSFEAKLAARLPNWNAYPAPAQAALFDMGFNLGPEGLMKFHQLLAAEQRVSATTIQTVGSKGYDGFTLALVIAERLAQPLFG